MEKIISRPTATVLSVVIVNWNTRDLLRKCLESIYADTPSMSLEVIVVDNASTDGSAEMVADQYPQVKLIRSKTNVGFSAGNNLGIAQSGGRYVMLLNPDTEIMPKAMDRMLEFMETHPHMGVVGPKLLNSDGSLQKNGRVFPSFAREFLHITRLYRLALRTFELRFEWGREDFDEPVEVDTVSGACMFVRRSAIDQVGLLDEKFFMYYEEDDWCHRMRRAGWSVYYLSQAQVVHHAGQASRKTGLFKMRTAYRSQYLYLRKHHGLMQAIIIRAVSGLILGLMYLKQKVLPVRG